MPPTTTDVERFHSRRFNAETDGPIDVIIRGRADVLVASRPRFDKGMVAIYQIPGAASPEATNAALSVVNEAGKVMVTLTPPTFWERIRQSIGLSGRITIVVGLPPGSSFSSTCRATIDDADMQHLGKVRVGNRVFQPGPSPATQRLVASMADNRAAQQETDRFISGLADQRPTRSSRHRRPADLIGGPEPEFRIVQEPAPATAARAPFDLPDPAGHRWPDTAGGHRPSEPFSDVRPEQETWPVSGGGTPPAETAATSTASSTTSTESGISWSSPAADTGSSPTSSSGSTPSSE